MHEQINLQLLQQQPESVMDVQSVSSTASYEVDLAPGPPRPTLAPGSKMLRRTSSGSDEKRSKNHNNGSLLSDDVLALMKSVKPAALGINNSSSHHYSSSGNRSVASRSTAGSGDTISTVSTSAATSSMYRPNFDMDVAYLSHALGVPPTYLIGQQVAQQRVRAMARRQKEQRKQSKREQQEQDMPIPPRMSQRQAKEYQQQVQQQQQQHTQSTAGVAVSAPGGMVPPPQVAPRNTMPAKAAPAASSSSRSYMDNVMKQVEDYDEDSWSSSSDDEDDYSSSSSEDKEQAPTTTTTSRTLGQVLQMQQAKPPRQEPMVVAAAKVPNAIQAENESPPLPKASPSVIPPLPPSTPATAEESQSASSASSLSTETSQEFQFLLMQMNRLEATLVQQQEQAQRPAIKSAASKSLQIYYQNSLKQQLVNESNQYTQQLADLHVTLADLHHQMQARQREMDRLELAIAMTRQDHVALRDQLHATKKLAKQKQQQAGSEYSNDDSDDSSSDDDSDISETDAFLTDDPMTKALLQMGHKLKEEKQRRQQKLALRQSVLVNE